MEAPWIAPAPWIAAAPWIVVPAPAVLGAHWMAPAVLGHVLEPTAAADVPAADAEFAAADAEFAAAAAHVAMMEGVALHVVVVAACSSVPRSAAVGIAAAAGIAA